MSARLLAGTVIALAAAGFGACRGPSRTAVGAGPDGDAASTADDAAAAVTSDAAVDAALPLPDDSMAATLVRESGGEPVLLVDRAGALVATTPSGTFERVLVPAPSSHGLYDTRTWTLWFHRGGRELVLDLTRTGLGELAVIDGMPDADLWLTRFALDDEGCIACVVVGIAPAPALAAVTAEPAQGLLPRALRARQRTVAASRPVFTAEGKTFVAGLAGRGLRTVAGRPIPPRHVMPLVLGDARAPLPRSAATHAHPSPAAGRGFAVASLGRTLLVAGQVCDCARTGGCSGRCVWFDAGRGYAPLREPGRWASDARPEPGCHPELDVTGTAYVLGHDGGHSSPLFVCNADACRRERGRFLGWLEPGATSTGALDEDLSLCEH